MNKTRLLEVKDLSIQIVHDDTLLTPVDGVSFSLNRGEIMALIGESGSGKTLTALAVNRLLPPGAELLEHTEIFLDEQPIHQLSEVEMHQIRGLKIGMIFQDPSLALNPVLTIGDQLAEALRKSKRVLSNANLKTRMEELLNQVRIPDPGQCLKAYPHQLSGGMKQRVVIAIAIANAPDLLIADEATTNLDVTTQAQVLKLIQDLHQAQDMGILLITHDFGIVAEMANTVSVMTQGKIVEQTSKEQFIKAPQHAYTKKLFAALPENLDDQVRDDEMHDTDKSTDLTVERLKVNFPITRGILKRKVGAVKAVDGVSFALKEGRTLALVGESGCGKTTTAKAIMRLIREGTGVVDFQGKNLLQLSQRQLKPLRGDMQMVFQDPFASMDPRFKVIDIIKEGMKPLKIGSDDAERIDRINHVIESVGLTSEYLQRYPHQLSGGQRQRVAIARALILGPQILICDEPTSALDLSVQAQILKLLRSIQEDFNISMLFITHNISVVNYLAHEIAVMYLGRIVETGPAQTVIAQPKHPYTKALMAAVPSVTHDKIPMVIKGEPPSASNPPKGCHFAARCPKVHARCLASYPGSYAVGESRHVSCFLYDK